MRSSTSIIESCKDAWRSTFLDEVTYDLVIEIFDGRPLNLFANVLLLFGLECEFDKNLLEFFVHVVDAQLLERIVLSR